MTYNYGDTMWVREVLNQESMAGWQGLKPLTDTDISQYSPPPGWAILQNRATSYGNNNGSYSVTTLAGGSDFEEQHYIEQAFDNAIDAAASAQDYAASLAFEEQKQEMLSTLDRYKSSHNIIQLTTEARGHGSAVNRKRGWMKMRVDVELMFICKPGCAGELEQRLKSTIIQPTDTNEDELIIHRPMGSVTVGQSGRMIDPSFSRVVAQQSRAINQKSTRDMLRR